MNDGDLDFALTAVRGAGLAEPVLASLSASGIELWMDSIGVKGLQHELYRAQLAWIHQAILADLPAGSQQRAIWLSVKAGHSGACLGAQCLEKDTGLDDEALQLNICTDLGLPAPWLSALPSQMLCPLGCTVDDGSGRQVTRILAPRGADFLHAFTCPIMGKVARHNALESALADELKDKLASRGVVVDRRHRGYLENGFVPKDTTLARALDIGKTSTDIVIRRVGARSDLVDVTVVTPSVTASRSTDSRNETSLLRRAVQKKATALATQFYVPDPPVHNLVWFAVSTFGRLHDGADEQLRVWSREISPPRTKSDGKDWDVDGLMARQTGRLRAVVQRGRVLGCQQLMNRFKEACTRQLGGHLTPPLFPEFNVYGVT
ncbi:hypothetical protein DFJ74DRAFT_721362 [Hyaloraphidium curvatum]|nr:hypothetical protein DFJ74DRAFT_721362 [Hyaloraphidium curvatum]